MRKLLLFILLLMLSLNISAQNNVITLKGKVFDKLTHSDLVGTKIELLQAADHKILNTAIASQKIVDGDKVTYTSDYDLSAPRQEGNYVLRYTKEGYDTVYVNLNLHRFYKREFSMFLAPAYLSKIKTYNLDEIKVTATKIKFYNKGDTLVYNADAFQLSEGSMLDALVRQLPGAQLTKNGQIYVNGRYVESLLLNGKDFFKGDNKIMLDYLPTYMVSQIKVYDKLGDNSRFLGAEAADDKHFVMDVKLKKQYSVGWSGNLEAGGGTKDRYLARLFAMRYTDHSRVTFYGNFNDLNDTREPGEDDYWTPSALVTGLTHNQVGGLDYSVDSRDSKYTLEGNVQLSHVDNHTDDNIYRTNFLTGGNTYDRIKEAARNHSVRLYTAHRFYFEFNNFNLDIQPHFNYSKNKFKENHISATLSRSWDDINSSRLDSLLMPSMMLSAAQRADLINRNVQQELNKADSLQAALQVQSVIKLKHTSDYITLQATGGYRNSSSDIYSHYLVDYFTRNNTASDYRNRYFHARPDHGYDFSGKAAYTYVIHRGLTLTFSYEYARKYTSSYSDLFRLDQLDGWGEGSSHALGALPSMETYLRSQDKDNSYNSGLKTNTQTLEPFLVWNKTTKNAKWWAQLRLPVSILSRTLHYVRGDVDTTFTRHTTLVNMYSSFLKWNSLDRKYSASLQYTVNSQAPDMNLLVNTLDTSDPLNVYEGNGNLKNAYQHELLSSFTRMYPKKGLMWAIEATFRPTVNAIAMGYTYDKSSGHRLYRPDNVNGNWYGSLQIGGGGVLNKARTLSFKGFVGVNYNRSVDLIELAETPASLRSIVRTTSFTDLLHLDYRIGQSTIGVKMNGNWSHASSHRADFEPFNISEFGYGLTGKVSLPGNMQLATDLTMYCRRGYADKSMNTNDLVWNARLSYPLLEGRLVMMLDGFDILGQLSNATRVLNAQALTETYRNVIPRYLLFHVAYHFNIAPKKR